MTAVLSLIVALSAFAVSAITLWLTHFRGGSVKMTRPTQIYFGPDGGKEGSPKVYVRAMLYSTAKRGYVIENLYARLSRGQTSQAFSIWVHGDKAGLTRGSGLFVDQNGLTVAHHFLLPPDGALFQFAAGEYLVEIVARLVGKGTDFIICSEKISLHASEADQVRDKSAGVYFDWGPHTNSYHSHIDKKPPKEDFLLELIGHIAQENSIGSKK